MNHQSYVDAAAYELANPRGDRLLLLLHGLGGDRQQSIRLLGQWNAARLTVLAPDLRGHGDTRVTGDKNDYALDALADDVLALVAHLGQSGKPTYIAGISMGAAWAPPSLSGWPFVVFPIFAVPHSSARPFPTWSHPPTCGRCN